MVGDLFVSGQGESGSVSLDVSGESGQGESGSSMDPAEPRNLWSAAYQQSHSNSFFFLRVNSCNTFMDNL